MTPPVWLTETSPGVTAMDKLHHDFFEGLAEVSSLKDHEFSAGYGAFVTRVEQIFRQEEEWMEDIDFPVSKVHQEQHARVLGALHHVHSRLMSGELGVGREAVDQLLPEWFAFHISTMDAPLALAMQMAPAGTGLPSQRSGSMPETVSAPS